jgi:ubiquinone/menaquinone biosynthesis C-methylase UbiE
MTRSLLDLYIATLCFALVSTACGGASPAPEAPDTILPSTSADLVDDEPADVDEEGRPMTHVGQGMHHRFDDPDYWVQVFEGPERDAWQRPDELVAAMSIAPGMTVADLGAGTGYLLSRFHEAVGAEGEVLALDAEASLVAFMAERVDREGWSNVTPRQVPYDDPELRAGSVDRVLILDTWHHIGDREAYAARLAAGLTDGGELWIVDFTQDSEMGPPVHHRVTVEQVTAELEAGGFAVARVDTELLPHQFIVVATVAR